MAIVAMQPLWSPCHGKLLAALDERGVGRFERQERRMDARKISRHIGDIVRRKRLRDRRHEGARPHARGKVAQLPRKIKGRLTGEPRKRAAGIGNAIEGVALGAGRSAGRRALRDDHGPMLGVGSATCALRHDVFQVGQVVDNRRGVLRGERGLEVIAHLVDDILPLGP